MGNLFGTIRDKSSTLINDINNDRECQTWHIKDWTRAYMDAANMYRRAAHEDFTTMLCAMQERDTTKRIQDYHEWIALYMHGMSLTNEELQYRQELAKRMNEDG